jgi:putative ABC transport system ATP-binding protein
MTGGSAPAAPATGTATSGPEPDTARAALELRDVVKEYPGRPPVRALDDVSLRIDHGELVAIVGPSGSGKSTLLNVMGTLDRPTSGVVAIDGTDTARWTDDEVAGMRSRKIGFVFQQFFLLPGLSALENVANGLLYQGVPPAERAERSAEALQRVGLGHRLHHPPNHLSGGEQQRVAVARALVHRPAFVLADEPTGNLDSRSTAAVMTLIRNLNAEGTTIVVITHDQAIADALPRQLSVLDGRIQSDRSGRASTDTESPHNAEIGTDRPGDGNGPGPPERVEATNGSPR